MRRRSLFAVAMALAVVGCSSGSAQDVDGDAQSSVTATQPVGSRPDGAAVRRAARSVEDASTPAQQAGRTTGAVVLGAVLNDVQPGSTLGRGGSATVGRAGRRRRRRVERVRERVPGLHRRARSDVPDDLRRRGGDLRALRDPRAAGARRHRRGPVRCDTSMGRSTRAARRGVRDGCSGSAVDEPQP